MKKFNISYLWILKPKGNFNVRGASMIDEYVHSLFGKNSENSHFSTFTHLAGSGRNHDILSEMSALGLS